MPDITTVKLPVDVRDRLRRYGAKGQTYADIVTALMDRVSHEDLMRDLYAKLDDEEGTRALEDL